MDKDDGLYQALKEVDNVRPLLQVPAWVQGVCNHFPKVEDKIHRVWNDTVDRFFALDFVRDHDRWGPDFMDFLEMALRLTSSFSFDKLREILGTWLAKGLYQNRNNYRHFAYEELPLQRNEARYVVYGHTHKAEQVPLDNVLLPGPPAEMRQKIYFNSGTWRKVFEQTVYDPDSCEFIGWHVMTFLVFYLAGEREPDRHFEMWSASLG